MSASDRRVVEVYVAPDIESAEIAVGRRVIGVLAQDPVYEKTTLEVLLAVLDSRKRDV